jgi:hypothetical protein
MGMCRQPLRWLKAVLRPAEPKSTNPDIDMQYFYNLKKKSTKAHIWTGNDTACKMLSTGGIRKGIKSVYDSTDGREVCSMCKVNHMKSEISRSNHAQITEKWD